MDTPFSHSPFCANLVSAPGAHGVTRTPAGTRCIHPPLSLEGTASGTAPKQRPLPAARTEMKEDACTDGLLSQPGSIRPRGS